MCGISGIIAADTDPKIISNQLKKVNQYMYKRGPDDDGFYFSNNVGLAIRRLKIIDLKGGHQPISNEDGSVWVVFNGEIYNFKLLRKILIAKGHSLRTRTDTEVIVHLYEEYGTKLFSHLNGMFAIAIWDEKEKQLVLARDRLGKKPLHYALFNKTFIFASELKALLQYPNLKKIINLNSLNSYLSFEYIPTPDTILENIYQLEPGSYLIFKNGQYKIKPFWEMVIPSQPKEELTERETIARLDDFISEAVKIRLVSDVPLGVFLSGGIDSTTISYYAAKNSSKSINSFSIGFTESSFDESKYAQLAAKKLALNHHHYYFSQKDLTDLIPKLTDFMDQPLADASLLPTYLLSKFAKQKVTVSLGGDGGDELFLGYPTYQAAKIAEIYKYLPKWLRQQVITPIIHLLPTSDKNFSLDFKVKRFIMATDLNPVIRNQIWLGSFSPEEKATIFNKKINSKLDPSKPLNSLKEKYYLNDKNLAWRSLIHTYLKTYLLDDILVKVDRASMAASLEVRSPFLDYRVVDFINSLPIEMKLKGFQRKYILRELVKDKIPNEILSRPKKGFGIPLAKWFKNSLKSYLLETLSKEKIENDGYFSYIQVKKLIDEHLNGKKDNRKQLWTLMVFQLWKDRWMTKG